eukprot:s2105_g6.t1
MSSAFPSGAELDQVGEAPAVLDPYGGQQLDPAPGVVASASELIQEFRDRQEILAQAAAAKQEIKEELCQEGTEYQWVPLADGEVNWDVLMAPPSEHNEAWAWVPQANDIDSDDEGLVLWEAPDQDGLKKAWQEICSSLPVKAVKVEPVAEAVKPSAKTRAQRPVDSVDSVDSVDQAPMVPTAKKFPKMEKSTEERLEPWDPPTAKAKAQTAKPRQVVYKQPMVQPTPKTKNRHGQAQKPAQGAPPPPPPPPPPVPVATAAMALVKEVAECEDMTTEEAMEAAVGTQEDAEAIEQTEAEEMSQRFKNFLLKSFDMPVPAEEADREEAAFFRHWLLQELRKGPRTMEDGEEHNPRPAFRRSHPTSVLQAKADR